MPFTRYDPDAGVFEITAVPASQYPHPVTIVVTEGRRQGERITLNPDERIELPSGSNWIVER